MKKISEVLKSKGIRKTAGAALVCKKAEDLIKETLNIKDLEVVKYQGKALFLSTRSSASSQKIFENQTKLIEKIKKNLDIDLERISYRKKY